MTCLGRTGNNALGSDKNNGLGLHKPSVPLRLPLVRSTERKPSINQETTQRKQLRRAVPIERSQDGVKESTCWHFLDRFTFVIARLLIARLLSIHFLHSLDDNQTHVIKWWRIADMAANF